MKSLGFKNQLLLTLSLIIISCVGSASYFSYQHEKKSIIDTIYASTKERIRTEKSKIEQYLAAKTTAVSNIADNYKQHNYQGDHAERMKIASLAADVVNLMIGFENGEAYASYDYPGWTDHKNPPGYDPRTRPWYIKGMQSPDKAFVTEPYPDATTGELMVSIGKSAGVGTGVIIADIPLTVLSQTISETDMEGSAAVIMTEDDIVLASSSDYVKVGDKLSNQNELVDISEKIKRSVATTLDYELDGYDKVLFSEEIHYMDGSWYLLIGLDKDVVFKKLTAIKQQALLLVVVYLLISLLVTLVSLNILYRPILELRNTILGLSGGSGDIDQRLDVNSSDDLGQIAQGVNLVIDKIQDLLLHQEMTPESESKHKTGLTSASSQQWKEAFAQYKYRVNEEEKFKKELKLDTLTKLPTRSYFEVLLADAIKNVYNENSPENELLLFAINIGNYEVISESYTYDQIQKAILELAELIGNNLPENTVLSRTSPAEFSIIHNNVMSKNELNRIVQQLALTLRNIEAEGLFFRCKLGATYLSHSEPKPSVNSLLYQVSNALFSATRNSDENYAFYKKEQAQDKKQRQALISDFKLALKQNELELYLQPQVGLSTNHICGAEALIRWNHPQKGFLTPDKFLHILDDESLGTELGEWVIASALEMLASRDDSLTISVNITPLHIQNENFFVRLEEILHSYPPKISERLKIELTETSSISDHARVESSMRQCSKLNVRFSLDDFGTGYSTLNQLRSLPASELKIDRSFIQNFDKSKDDRKMVETMIMLARNFGISVVAEGVESIE